MGEKLIIQEFQNNQKEAHLEVETQVSLQKYQASGQMLVDSDNLSFVYLLEAEETYTYVIIPNKIWKELKIVLSEATPVFLSNGREKILLNQFHDELSYLIENIKGNSNYGEKMVAEVEAVFE
ncbi:hypothetical protein [Niallia sp. Krafla_26]|uniref:UPF0738 family protein n=1 Tax=Niallia sp. Krafla_26 TaxID=3064703 RepID=UPI003D16387C